jgi:hypothetical protein
MDDNTVITNLITLLAGLGGAILGSWVSGFITRQHANTEKSDRQKTEFFKLMIKCSQIQSDFTNLLQGFNESITVADSNGLANMPKWAKIQSNPDDFDKIEVSPDDLVCLFEAREYNLLSDIVELEMKHVRLFGAFNTYSRMRMELKDHMPISDANGPVVGANLTEEDALRLRPRLLELSSLLESIFDLLPRYVDESKSISEKLGPAARKYFGDPKFPILTQSPLAESK